MRILIALALVGLTGCAQRYTVPNPELMRGDTVTNVWVRTADGYEYHFQRAAVDGDEFVGTLVEEVETLGEGDEVYVAHEVREVRIPISNVITVEGEKRFLNDNALYVAGAVGIGAIVFATLAGTEVTDTQQRGSGPAIKPPPQ
jgi:hypothetical protein